MKRFTGPGRRREARGGAGEGREGVCRRGVIFCGPWVQEREGPRARGGAAASGWAEVTVFPSRSLGCSGSEGWPWGPRRGLWHRGGPAACSRAPGRRKPLFLSSPRPPRSAHTSSLTHFAAQAVIWRQRREPRLPGARFVLDASKPWDGALLRGRWDVCLGKGEAQREGLSG